MTASLTERALGQLTIDDEASFRDVPLYAALKAVLVRDGYRFRVLPTDKTPRWDRALLLNLTFWGGQGGDVLPEARIAADVVTHAAWHHLAGRAFRRHGKQSAEALFLGEAIASAFDLYLVGELLRRSGKKGRSSTFLDTQVPAMAETASAAGLSARGFEQLLGVIAADPRGAFEGLRALLVDVTRELFACEDAAGGLGVLQRHHGHRFAPLLHRFELSNWVLWNRAWGPRRAAGDARVRKLDRHLRGASDSLEALASLWLGEPR